jgi:hypothetical protein
MKNGMSKLKIKGEPRMSPAQRASAWSIRAVVALGALTLFSANIFAAGLSRDQAKRIYDRLAGVPASDTVLTQMTASADPVAAAGIAMNNPAFYNNTVRNLATPWTNRDQTVFAPLNDYTATVVGMVRDDVAFNTLLSADLVYIADSGSGVPAYSPANNDMYQKLDDNGVDLKAHLISSTQSSLTGVPAAATAGVMTTRGAASAFFIAGTNRAMFRFTMMNHLCHDMQTIMDTTRPPDRIRQDVARSPGGDSRIFLNNCIGCHSGMDPMAQAFAFYNYDETAMKIVYTAGQVQPKYAINSANFPQGYVTPDDHWNNRWRTGPNYLLGWDPALTGSGQGAKSLGQELGNSTAFADCQVEKVFRQVCFRAPGDDLDRAEVGSIVTSFKNGGYKLKQVYAQAAAYCMGS